MLSNAQASQCAILLSVRMFLIFALHLRKRFVPEQLTPRNGTKPIAWIAFLTTKKQRNNDHKKANRSKSVGFYFLFLNRINPAIH